MKRRLSDSEIKFNATLESRKEVERLKAEEARLEVDSLRNLIESKTGELHQLKSLTKEQVEKIDEICDKNSKLIIQGFEIDDSFKVYQSKLIEIQLKSDKIEKEINELEKKLEIKELKAQKVEAIYAHRINTIQLREVNGGVGGVLHLKAREVENYTMSDIHKGISEIGIDTNNDIYCKYNNKTHLVGSREFLGLILNHASENYDLVLKSAKSISEIISHKLREREDLKNLLKKMKLSEDEKDLYINYGQDQIVKINSSGIEKLNQSLVKDFFIVEQDNKNSFICDDVIATKEDLKDYFSLDGMDLVKLLSFIAIDYLNTSYKSILVLGGARGRGKTEILKRLMKVTNPWIGGVMNMLRNNEDLQLNGMMGGMLPIDNVNRNIPDKLQDQIATMTTTESVNRTRKLYENDKLSEIKCFNSIAMNMLDSTNITAEDLNDRVILINIKPINERPGTKGYKQYEKLQGRVTRFIWEMISKIMRILEDGVDFYDEGGRAAGREYWMKLVCLACDINYEEYRDAIHNATIDNERDLMNGNVYYVAIREVLDQKYDHTFNGTVKELYEECIRKNPIHSKEIERKYYNGFSREINRINFKLMGIEKNKSKRTNKGMTINLKLKTEETTRPKPVNLKPSHSKPSNLKQNNEEIYEKSKLEEVVNEKHQEMGEGSNRLSDEQFERRRFQEDCLARNTKASSEIGQRDGEIIEKSAISGSFCSDYENSDGRVREGNEQVAEGCSGNRSNINKSSDVRTQKGKRHTTLSDSRKEELTNYTMKKLELITGDVINDSITASKLSVKINSLYQNYNMTDELFKECIEDMKYLKLEGEYTDIIQLFNDVFSRLDTG